MLERPHSRPEEAPRVDTRLALAGLQEQMEASPDFFIKTINGGPQAFEAAVNRQVHSRRLAIEQTLGGNAQMRASGAWRTLENPPSPITLPEEGSVSITKILEAACTPLPTESDLRANRGIRSNEPLGRYLRVDLPRTENGIILYGVAVNKIDQDIAWLQQVSSTAALGNVQVQTEIALLIQQLQLLRSTDVDASASAAVAEQLRGSASSHGLGVMSRLGLMVAAGTGLLVTSVAGLMNGNIGMAPLLYGAVMASVVSPQLIQRVFGQRTALAMTETNNVVSSSVYLALASQMSGEQLAQVLDAMRDGGSRDAIRAVRNATNPEEQEKAIVALAETLLPGTQPEQRAIQAILANALRTNQREFLAFVDTVRNTGGRDAVDLTRDFTRAQAWQHRPMDLRTLEEQV